MELPPDPNDLPIVDVKTYIERLAANHGVVYQRTGIDDLAETITRLSGDEVTLDRTEKLLVALKKSGVINS